MTKSLSLIAIAAGLSLAACGHKERDTASASATPVAAAPSAEAVPVTPPAAANPVVGGAEMLPTRTIVENAVNSKDHTTLVAAVKAAGLAETLSGPGPFTVFAPANDAFARLAPGIVDTLLKPENKAALVKMLTYHVVPGRLTAADLKARIQAGGGKTVLATVEGQSLTATVEGNAIKLTDVGGNVSFITQGDVAQSNGMIHVVNGVLVPKLG